MCTVVCRRRRADLLRYDGVTAASRQLARRGSRAHHGIAAVHLSLVLPVLNRMCPMRVFSRQQICNCSILCRATLLQSPNVAMMQLVCGFRIVHLTSIM